jgi:hypothetical protein
MDARTKLDILYHEALGDIDRIVTRIEVLQAASTASERLLRVRYPLLMCAFFFASFLGGFVSALLIIYASGR